MEYCSHIWGGSSATYLLDRIESNVIELVNSPNLTSKLDPLKLRRIVGSLSLFYRYYFGLCSQELAACVPPPLARPRNTRQATTSPTTVWPLETQRWAVTKFVSSPPLPNSGTLHPLTSSETLITFPFSKSRFFTSSKTLRLFSLSLLFYSCNSSI